MTNIALKLRPYQQTWLHDIRLALRGLRAGGRAPRVLGVLPTGAGKTVAFSAMALGAVALGRRVLVATHRIEIAIQAGEKLTALGVPHGMIAAGFTPRPYEMVQVATIQTLINRLHKYAFDLIIVDEAHHAAATTYLRILNAYPRAAVVGVTATPCRRDGKPLNDIFNSLVIGPDVEALTGMGYLVPADVYAPGTIDLAGVHIQHGDYARGELATAADKPTITGCAIEHYHRHADGLRAIAFCCNVAHAEHVADQFRLAGYVAKCVHAGTPAPERAGAIAALASGEIQILTNCDLFGEGLDVPVVECGILLRPTQSLGLAMQQMGRILRPSPGKERAIILDHAGNVLRHGLPDTPRAWSLETDMKPKPKDDGECVVTVRQCPECFHAHRPAPVCPKCGHVYEVDAREIEQVDGTLVRVSAATLAAQEKARKAAEKAAAKDAKAADHAKSVEESREFRRTVWGAVARAHSFEDAQRVAEGYGMRPGYARVVWGAIGRRITGGRGQEAASA